MTMEMLRSEFDEADHVQVNSTTVATYASFPFFRDYTPNDRFGVWTAEKVNYPVPELAILPRLPRVLKFGLGLGLEAKVTHMLQRATAWLAAAILRAPREGVTIRMPRVRVEVAEACSGLQTLILLLSAAALIAFVQRHVAWRALVTCMVMAVILALVANALRVAGTAVGLEHWGALSLAAKNAIGLTTTGAALAGLVSVAPVIGEREVKGAL